MKHYNNEFIRGWWQDITKEFDDKSIDCIISDIPYGINYQSGRRKEKHQKIENDKAINVWFPPLAREFKRLLNPGGHIYIFASFQNIDVFLFQIKKHFDVTNLLIWDKKNHGMGNLEKSFANSYEMIIFVNTGNNLKNGRQPDILRFPKTQNKNHPTEKPVELYKYFMEKSTNKGDLVLDTHAGVFPVARAAKATGRRFIGIEKVQKYVEIGKQLYNNEQKELFS